MKMWNTFILLLLPWLVHAQSGFSNWYEIGTTADLIGITTSGTDLVAGGTITVDSLIHSGSHFIRFDTSGNVLNHHTLFDSAAVNYAFRDECEVSSDGNGGYFITGDALEDLADFISHYDANDSLLFHREYPYEAGIQVRLPRKVLPYQHGLFWLSSDAYDNFDIDISLQKLDSSGNQVWIKHYGHPGKIDRPWSLVQTSANEFLIGGYREAGSAPGSDGNMFCSRSWIFAVDSLGTKQWEWFGEPCSSEGVYDLQTTPDGGYIYLTRELEVFNEWNWGFAPKVVRRDADFNLLWERKLANSHGENFYAFSLNKTETDDWIAVGNSCLPEPCNNLNIPSDAQGVVVFYKISDQGDSIWRTAVPPPTLANETYIFEIGGAVTLSSGSSFAVGSFQEIIPFNYGHYPWLIKVDNDGCAESFCATTSSKDISRQPLRTNVYPNPASDHVTLEHDAPTALRIEIFTSTGQRMHTETTTHRAVWRTRAVAPGLYLYRFVTPEGVVLERGKIVVQ